MGDLGATYDDRLRLIGKRVVDFLLVLIELFSIGVTAAALRAKIDRKSAISLQRGQFDPKITRLTDRRTDRILIAPKEPRSSAAGERIEASKAPVSKMEGPGDSNFFAVGGL